MYLQREISGDKKVKWSVRILLRPEGVVRVVWEILVTLVLLYLAFIIPYTSAFEPSNQNLLETIDLISLIVFSIDILLNFNTAYYNKGEIVTNRVKIAKNYAKFWLWIDSFSAIPFNYIFVQSSHHIQTVNFFKLARELKLLKLVRLSQLKTLIFRLEDQIANEKFVSLLMILKLLLYLFLIAHFFACIMFSISSTDLGPNSFISSMSNKSYEATESTSDFYITSLYWAFSTMTAVGFGDLSPITTHERLFGVITMLLSSLMFGVIIGNIGSLIEKYSIKETERRETLTNANTFMKKKNLQSNLINKVRRYIDYAFHFDTYKEVHLKDMLLNLSIPLQEEIFFHTNGHAIKACKVFDSFPKTFSNQIAQVLQVEIFSPLDQIINEGQNPIGMYFILEGVVEVYDKATSRRIIVLSNKEYFGEIGLFTKKACVSSIVATDFTETLYLNFIEFDKIAELVPNAKEIVEEMRKSCGEGDYTSLMIHCYSCRQRGHIAKHCQVILEDENLKKHWIFRQQHSKKINIYEEKRRKYLRKVHKSHQSDYSAKYILGRARKARQMFPGSNRLISAIKRYFQGNFSYENNGIVLHTEESAMNTGSYLNNPYFDRILDSEETFQEFEVEFEEEFEEEKEEKVEII